MLFPKVGEELWDQGEEPRGGIVRRNSGVWLALSFEIIQKIIQETISPYYETFL